MTSPTQRSKKHLEDQGYLVEITERWNPWAKVRHDLFGIADLLALGPGETVAIQTTTYPHMKERIDKIQRSPHLQRLLTAGWHIRVHGWKAPTKKVRTWTLRSIDIDAIPATLETPCPPSNTSSTGNECPASPPSFPCLVRTSAL